MELQKGTYKAVTGVYAVTMFTLSYFNDLCSIQISRGVAQVDRKWRAQGMLRCRIGICVQGGVTDAMFGSCPSYASGYRSLVTTSYDYVSRGSQNDNY